jgi:hypothetical protein
MVIIHGMPENSKILANLKPKLKIFLVAIRSPDRFVWSNQFKRKILCKCTFKLSLNMISRDLFNGPFFIHCSVFILQFSKDMVQLHNVESHNEIVTKRLCY